MTRRAQKIIDALSPEDVKRIGEDFVDALLKVGVTLDRLLAEALATLSKAEHRKYEQLVSEGLSPLEALERLDDDTEK